MAENLATLADPTEHGYEPGNGPLRVGGQPATPERDKNSPATMSPAASRQRHALTLCRDLWAGTQRLKDRAQTYLPQSDGELPQHYRARLARSVFFNAFKRAAEGLTGLVFRKDPVLGTDVPEVIKQHWENIDNAGTHGDVFCREALQDDLIAGHGAILVEFPKTDGEQNAAAEMTGEVRPYWVWIKKDDLVSWRVRIVDGRTMLEQVVICERKDVPHGRFGTKEQVRYRVLFLTDLPATPVAWELLEINEANEVVSVDGGFYANQEEIPIAEITSSGKRSIFESDPPLEDVAHLNVAHYQMWSDYNWSIHKTCVPVLFGAGIPEVTDPQTGLKRPVKVGANSAVMTSEPTATLAYVSHSGEALNAIKQALDDLKNDMGTLGLAMLAPQKRSAETAEAKRLDKSTSDSALAVTARGLQDGIERALGFHARYLRLDSGGSVEINRDFEGLLMEAPVMQAYAALVNAGFPARAVLEALQAGGRIPADANLDELEMLWLVGQEAERQADRERQEEAAENMDDAA